MIEMPPDRGLAQKLLSGDPRNVIMDVSEARSIAMSMSSCQLHASRTTKSVDSIVRTEAAWIPMAYCGDLPSMDAIVVALTQHADKLLARMPWLVALAYSLDLPYKKYYAYNLPKSALKWDMKALSRQQCFTTIGVGMDPGNDVLSCVLCVCICRSGACVHDVHEKYMDEHCAACEEMPKLIEILSNWSEASKMTKAQLLLLAMQRRYSSCLLYTSPSPRDKRQSRMPSSA